MLTVSDLTVRRGAVDVVKGVSFEVPDDACVAIVGANGAGKSSTALALAGVLRHRGEIVLGAETLTRMKAFKRARAGLVLVPEGHELFPRLTVDETLRLAKENAPAGGSWSIKDMYGLFPALAARRRVASGNLSGGERQMLGIARGLLLKPRLLIVDEPSSGLSPKLVGQISQSLTRLRQTGLSVLVVEQNLQVARAVADLVIVMRDGEIVLTGDRDLLSQRDGLAALYLG